MSDLDFNIEIEGITDPEALRHAADQVRDALAALPELEAPVAAPIAGARTLGVAIAAIAVTVKIVVDVTKGIDAITATIEKLRKLGTPAKGESESVLARIDPARILIDVDGIMVPLTKLTAAHLKTLSEG
jgi:hypothetical protein